MSNTEKKDAPLNLHKLARTLLIVGIVAVGGFLIYSVTHPETEEDLVFLVLNSDHEQKDYPTEANPNQLVAFYVFVDNELGEEAEFSVRVYQGANVSIDRKTGVATDILVYQTNSIDETIANGNSWTSDMINANFTTIGTNQILIFELWQKIDGEWKFIPEYILFIRLDIHS